MLIRFEEFLCELEKTSLAVAPEVRARLDELLKKGVGQQAKRNIYDERLVDNGEWDVLTRSIVAAPSTYEGVTAAIRQIMREHKLQGKEADHPPGVTFGRAATELSIAQTLHGQAALGTLESAIYHVGLYKRVPVTILKKRWRNILIGRHVMWSTFEPSGGDPFAFAPTPPMAKEIGPVLGLPEETRFQPLLLLRYELPSTIKPRIPRITEAYAGDVWVYYFRPADAEDIERGFGRTYVWDSHAGTHAGRPEIVHEPLSGEHLVMDIEEAL